MSWTSRREFVRAVVATSGAALIGCGDEQQEASAAGSIGGGGAGGQGSGGNGASGGDGGTGGAGPIVGPEEIPEADAFPLGIASGDATGEDVVLWCRYTGTLDLEARVYEMDGDVYVAELGPFAAIVADYGIVHVLGEGLEYGKRYRFAFFEIESGVPVARSAIG